MSEALDGSGNVTFQQLYAPYGGSRYTNGTSPTSEGFTGQRSDATTGLDYYHARYYDPVASQFVSADTVQDGLNRYAYVHGNPETATDPTGHDVFGFLRFIGALVSSAINAWVGSLRSSGDVHVVSGGRPGAVSANTKGAFVGDPKVVSRSSMNDVYQWGDTEAGRGALAYEYQGTQIDALIQADTIAKRNCNTGGCFWFWEALAAAVGTLLGGIAGSVAPGPGTGAGAAAGSFILASFVQWVLNSRFQDLDDAIAALQQARDTGTTVFYATAWFAPPGTGGIAFARQEVPGSAQFQGSLFATQIWIGDQMEHWCQALAGPGSYLPSACS